MRHTAASRQFHSILIEWAELDSPLSSLARKIQYCEDRDLFIYATYILSTQNLIADAKSRIISEETEWSLNQEFYNKIDSTFGPFNLDLFATSINTKCSHFVFWFSDPMVHAVDAFSLDWSKFYFYVFPAFILILRVLRKIISDGAEKTLVVSWCPAQSWFPFFNRLLVGHPIYFNPDAKILSSPFRESHPTWNKILGSREVIRQTFPKRGIPSTAIETTLASITDPQLFNTRSRFDYGGNFAKTEISHSYPHKSNFFWNFYRLYKHGVVFYSKHLPFGYLPHFSGRGGITFTN